jgi:transcriptional antiterminator NusG
MGRKCSMGWYALFVETGREEQIKKHIQNTMNHSSVGIPYELPIARREVRERINGDFAVVAKRMFPGYILLKTENILDFYLKVKAKRSEHFLGILRHGGYFKEIRLEEISNIIYMTDSDGVIGSSDVFVENDRIIVTKGPLAKYDGFIKKIDRRRHRITALFMFNGAQHYIDLSVNFIEKYDENILGKGIPFFANFYFQGGHET